MTTGDWLGLVCLAALLGFFGGGFSVWQLFFKRQADDEGDLDDEEDGSEDEEVADDEGQKGIKQ